MTGRWFDRLRLGRARTAARAGAPARRPATTVPRGFLLTGTVWRGGDHEPEQGSVILAADGTLARFGGADDRPTHGELPVVGGAGCWVGPAICDVHVHLANLPEATAAGLVAGGVAAVRDLGSPLERLVRWRHAERGPLRMAFAGPLLGAPRGYPSAHHGGPAGGVGVQDVHHARVVIARLVAARVDVCKLILEPGPGSWPTPGPDLVQAVVRAAHEAGLPVVAHALGVDMVARALDAGVDELAHTPTERLPDALVERIAAAGIGVVSTLQTFFSAGVGATAAANAAALARAGVPLRYGTDFSEPSGRVGVDPRELDRLAAAGLGRLGALRSATVGAAAAPGMRGFRGLLELGMPADLVVLGANPLVEPLSWHTPRLVVVAGELVHDARGALQPV